MRNLGLWKYCTREQCNEFLVSLQLFGETEWELKKQIACLYAVSNHIEKHYQPVVMAKRDGSERHLLVPDSLLMKIQKNILHHILDRLSISSYAMAYHKGATVISNAAVHVGKCRILKLDIEDFFGSIRFIQVYQYAFPTIYIPPAAGMLLTHLCCYQDYLPQGAPTSASISNLVMKPFDEHMGVWCGERGIIYSRYCDDMTFSGDFDVYMVTCKVRNFLNTMGFALNEKKTQVIPCYRRQIVTGIVVNQKPQVTKEYRRKLKQELYYCKKFGVKSHLKQMKDKRYLPMGDAGIQRYLLSLCGKVNFVLQVNPLDVYFIKAKESLLSQKKIDKKEGDCYDIH